MSTPLCEFETLGGCCRRCGNAWPEGAPSAWPVYRPCAAATEPMNPGPKRPWPSLRREAVSLAQAVVNFVASGGELADAATLAGRLAICGDCRERYDGPAGARCQRCGCLLAAKTRMASETCPLGKW